MCQSLSLQAEEVSLDQDQDPARGSRHQTIAIHIHVTPLSLLIGAICVVLAVIFFANAARPTANVSATESSAAGPGNPSPAESYPAPAAMQAPYPIQQQAILSLPPVLPPSSGPTDTPVPAGGKQLLGAVTSAKIVGMMRDEPVGIGAPPVFNPTIVGQIAVSPTVVDFWVEPLPVQATQGPAGVAPAPATPAPAVPAKPAEPISRAADAPTVAPASPTAAPAPVQTITDAAHWTLADGPKVLKINLHIPSGASLTIDPGVEVQLYPGVSITVNGTLKALGTPDQPVRFVGRSGQPQDAWDGIYGESGLIALSSTQIHMGGAGGTLIASNRGTLVIQNSQLTGNFGQVRATDSRVDLNGVEMSGNTLPYGAAIQVSYMSDNLVSLSNNRVTQNKLTPGSAAVQIVASNAIEGIQIEVKGNLLSNVKGPDLEVFANAILKGNVVCNTFSGGSPGLSLLSDAPFNFDPGLNVGANAIEGQSPPIIPFYIEHGIGRGATSSLPLNMTNNWWNDALGPYEPSSNPYGRGEAVGPNITYRPWLETRPA